MINIQQHEGEPGFAVLLRNRLSHLVQAGYQNAVARPSSSSSKGEAVRAFTSNPAYDHLWLTLHACPDGDPILSEFFVK